MIEPEGYRSVLREKIQISPSIPVVEIAPLSPDIRFVKRKLGKGACQPGVDAGLKRMGRAFAITI
jgi:hypothetical protein